jgi:hypothetical protein
MISILAYELSNLVYYVRMLGLGDFFVWLMLFKVRNLIPVQEYTRLSDIEEAFR